MLDQRREVTVLMQEHVPVAQTVRSHNQVSGGAEHDAEAAQVAEIVSRQGGNLLIQHAHNRKAAQITFDTGGM